MKSRRAHRTSRAALICCETLKIELNFPKSVTFLLAYSDELCAARSSGATRFCVSVFLQIAGFVVDRPTTVGVRSRRRIDDVALSA
jgi:hypothetical protein